jgi:polyhydroxyalkanoate synthase subunit PhaC
MVLAHLAAQGGLDRIAAASFAVTVLDWARAGTVGALMDPEAVREATEKSRKKGYLDGGSLAEVFAWLRPNDLVRRSTSSTGTPIPLA